MFIRLHIKMFIKPNNALWKNSILLLINHGLYLEILCSNEQFSNGL